MIIGITGTTSGIGKAIIDLPYDFVSFNRDDGNINDPQVVYEKLKDCDVFINNAWENDCQTKLLNFFFDNSPPHSPPQIYWNVRVLCGTYKNKGSVISNKI